MASSQGNMVFLVIMLMLGFAVIGAYMFTEQAFGAEYHEKVVGQEANNTSVIGTTFLNRSKGNINDNGPR